MQWVGVRRSIMTAWDSSINEYRYPRGYQQFTKYTIPVIMVSINLADFDCVLTSPVQPCDALSCIAVPHIALPLLDAIWYDLPACLHCSSTRTDRSNSKWYDSIDLVNSSALFFLAVLLRLLVRGVQRTACLGPREASIEPINFIH